MFLDAVARLPCLQCGHQTKQFPMRSDDSSDILTKWVGCGRKQLPLACSRECADTLQKNRPDLLIQYDSMMEDTEYSATPEAIKLFAEVLQPDRRDSIQWKNNIHLTSWTEYFKLYQPDDHWLKDVRALRMLSSAYSYVMTLSKFLSDLLAPYHADSEKKVDLHIIGARAEATMPRYLWDDLSFFHPGWQFNITLVGNHVPVMPARNKTRSKENTLVQLEMTNGLYHESVARKLTTPDAFVMYNPGIGHPYLRESWEPTVLSVLASRKPMLITSFNLEDQQRDIKALQKLVAKLHGYKLQFRSNAEQNPFRSLKLQVDPRNVKLPIQTNSRAMVVQLVQAM
ncbi:uncharacterized protein PHALS_00202 [Plasmopara halstedii]|uniref:Mitochondrial splicing suppressor 51-like C-terminal domain-containing protein n=1 Tax=Plasmopara halstedii TaxID=4781 RepID=A0A0N7L3H3_PLAHL|nr:uncharacterized protein PHALS_00202 [Plasmopara halstedii]CEG35875.1 hypothetical protein PHALS_00202 [Plasmopara halstedii]|eukprot:XP_024572244.1 hypothetical protein PHALS_00202 [Plasmopara halstedii]